MDLRIAFFTRIGGLAEYLQTSKNAGCALLQVILLLIAANLKFVVAGASTNLTAMVVWEYRGPPYFYSSVGGDADRLPNGNTLITIPNMRRIIEVTMDGEKVWEVIFENATPIYRSERVLDLDMNSSDLYNPDGYPTSFTVNVTTWNQQKAANGITFAMVDGYVWGINMTGHAIWRYAGYWIGTSRLEIDWYEQKMLPNNHLLLVRPNTRARYFIDGGGIREIDLDGNTIWDLSTNVHHDAIKLNEYNIMYLSRVVRKINGTIYFGDEIRHVNLKERRIVWRWNTFDYLPVNANCTIDIAYGDWTHSNSLTASLENNRKVVYLDVRNLNQIVKIDYDTKQIIWKLGEDGDFRMFEKNGIEVTKLFSHQHDPEIQPDGNILLFDNGYHRNEEQKPHNRPSRAIEIQLTGFG